MSSDTGSSVKERTETWDSSTSIAVFWVAVEVMTAGNVQELGRIPARPEYRRSVPLVNRHEPKRAWILGLGYFATCWLLAIVAGVSSLFREPLGDGTAPTALAAAWLFALVAAYLGYWVIWPRGTFTGDRPLHVVAATTFGALHGASEGILYVAVWLQISGRVSEPALLVAATVAVIGVFNVSWRTLVWDVWVTPLHNIVSWNTRKVLFVHLPVLALAVAHLTVFESVLAFLSIQVVALVGATIHMRFPSPPRAGRVRAT